MNNILGKVPDQHKAEIKAFLTAVRDAPNYESGYQRAEELISRFEKDFPSSFKDDLEASLAHLYLPVDHRKYVRTTNLIERRRGSKNR